MVIRNDISCDSLFMKENLNKFAKAWREFGTQLNIPTNERMFLNMDNAGGHGTESSRDQFEEEYLQKYNIKIKYQPARSPDINGNDLGF